MGRSRPEHSDRHSIAFVRQGAFKFHRGADEHMIDSFTAVLFAEGDRFSVSHPCNCGDECIEIWFSNDLRLEARSSVNRYATRSKLEERSAVLPIHGGIRTEAMMLATRIERQEPDPLEIEERLLKLLEAVSRLEEAGSGNGAAARRRNRNRALAQVETVKEMLLSDLGRLWTLNELAADVGASPFHLTRLMREFTGMTLHQYLNRQRLAAAHHAVLSGADNLALLAFDVGFSSHSHFTAAFKKEYGVTPSRLRRSLRATI